LGRQALAYVRARPPIAAVPLTGPVVARHLYVSVTKA
jgi:hypothetical protein